METRIPIPLPVGGLNTDSAFGDQPQGTLRTGSVNVRCEDPPSGRTRLSQRAGLSKFNGTQVNPGSKIDDMAYVVFDNKRATYAERTSGSATIVWDSTTPAKTQCRNIVADRQANVYALSGPAGIVKYNAEGTERFKIAVPVEDPAHALVALFVDELDDIYTGVGSGGDQRTAKAWKYVQGPDPDEFSVRWVIEPGGYVEDIVVKNDKAYLAVNFADENRSQVQVYDTIDEPTPRLVQRFRAPYPINGMDVNSSGEVFTAHPFNPDALSNRPSNPKAPGFRQTVIDWTPRDLTDWQERIYRWHDAEALADFSEGDPILQWPDISGHDRHLFANFGTAFPPTYAGVSIAGKPSVRFESDNTGTWEPAKRSGLETRKNPRTAENTRSEQQTFVPANTGSAWTLYMVVRMVTGADLPEVIWGQKNNGTGNDILKAMLANRNESNTRNSTVTSGEFSVYDQPNAGDVAGGTNGHPISFTYSATATSCHLITWQCDGGLNSGVPGTTATRSVLRVDGNPIDRWESESNLSDGPSYLGSNGPLGTFVSGNSSWGGLNGQIAEILVLERTDYTSTAQPTVQTEDRLPDAGAGDQTENEMTMVEGYLMHKWGIQGQAPDSGDTYPHPYGGDANGFTGPPSDGSTGIYGATLRGGALTLKWSAAGEIVWGVETVRDRIGGIGVDVRLGTDETVVYTLGDHSNNIIPANNFNIRRMVDNGTSATFKTGSDYWAAVAGGATLNSQHVKIDTDKFDNVYVPLSESTQANSLVVFDKTGDGAGANTAIQTVDLSTNQRGIAVAVDPLVPEYGDDAVDIAEHVYLGSENNATATEKTVHKISLVSVVATTGSYRTAQLLAVSNGAIRKVSASGVPSTPTGGSGALSTTTGYIESTVLRGIAYFADGVTYKKYVGKDDEVVEWKATKGKIPPRCRLITSWRGRIVLAGDPDNGSLWHMSSSEDPDDWDQFPPEPLATQAISANNQSQTAGMVPDIINTLIPYNDDYLIFGGDHSIWQLSGDPMAGGELDLVSDITGMAFGRPWAKDPNGVIYFVGSRGGLYRMTPGSAPQRISQHTIERLLNDALDFSTHYVRMVYSWEEEGLRIFQLPFDTVTQVDHFFWDQKRGAPYQDKHALTSAGNLDIQPTAVAVIDGDTPDDRFLLIGCADSYIRKLDRDARDDDGTRIVSKAIIGPIAGSEEPVEVKFSLAEIVLADDQQGATYSLFANSEPSNMGVALSTDYLLPGRNPYISSRMRGSYCWLSLENGAVGERWSLESASIRAIPAGRKRARHGT